MSRDTYHALCQQQTNKETKCGLEGLLLLLLLQENKVILLGLKSLTHYFKEIVRMSPDIRYINSL